MLHHPISTLPVVPVQQTHSSRCTTHEGTRPFVADYTVAFSILLGSTVGSFFLFEVVRFAQLPPEEDPSHTPAKGAIVLDGKQERQSSGAITGLRRAASELGRKASGHMARSLSQGMGRPRVAAPPRKSKEMQRSLSRGGFTALAPPAAASPFTAMEPPPFEKQVSRSGWLPDDSDSALDKRRSLIHRPATAVEVVTHPPPPPPSDSPFNGMSPPPFEVQGGGATRQDREDAPSMPAPTFDKRHSMVKLPATIPEDKKEG